MDLNDFQSSLTQAAPPEGLSVPLSALWYDAKGEWTRAHDLVDDLETQEGMTVHAYLHRKNGDASNADYWYERAGRNYFRPDSKDEWKALVESLLSR